MRKYVIIFVILGTIVLSACRQAGDSPPTPTQAVQEEVQANTAEPQSTSEAQVQPTSQDSTSYPAPPTYIPATPRTYPSPEGGTIITATPFTVPTPGSDTGVVTGKLVNVENGEPMAFQTIYLGHKIYLTPGPGYTYGLQENSSPHTNTTPDGEFAIGEVPPGEYILMIFTPFGASVVMQPNSDRELDVVIVAGKVVDLGTMDAVLPELR